MSDSRHWEIDHIVLAVADLSTAIDDFSDLGFKVEPGGSNGPTHNALILFSDGRYIELISASSSSYAWLFKALRLTGILRLLGSISNSITPRLLYWLSGDFGLKDWCLRCDDIDEALADLQRLNIPCTPAQRFSRTRPDGQIAHWKLAAPKDRSLPFFIQDVSHKDIRVPYQDHCQHPNKVTGIHAIKLNICEQQIKRSGLHSLLNASGLNRGGEIVQLLSKPNRSQTGLAETSVLLASNADQPRTLSTQSTSGASIEITII